MVLDHIQRRIVRKVEYDNSSTAGGFYYKDNWGDKYYPSSGSKESLRTGKTMYNVNQDGIITIDLT